MKGGYTDPDKLIEMLNISNNGGERCFSKEATIINNGKFDGTIKKGIYGNGELKVELLDDVQVNNGIPQSDIKLVGRFKWGQEKIDELILSGGNIEIKSLTTLRPTARRNSGKVNVKPPISILVKK